MDESNEAFSRLIEAMEHRKRDFEENRKQAERLLASLRIQKQLQPHEAVLMELLLMSFADTRSHGDPERAAFLGETRQRTREIGQQLNRLGGWNLMSWVADKIPKYDQRELEVAWDGIGKWRC